MERFKIAKAVVFRINRALFNGIEFLQTTTIAWIPPKFSKTDLYRFDTREGASRRIRIRQMSTYYLNRLLGSWRRIRIRSVLSTHFSGIITLFLRYNRADEV